jgi:hypothetical protein
MANRALKTAAGLCILFCTSLVARQCWFLLNNGYPERIAHFAHWDRLTSTLETALVSVVGVIASSLLLARQTAPRGVVIGVFCFLMIWHQYLANLHLYFRPPFGDGSLHSAAAAWWRLHAPLIWIHGLSVCVLAWAGVSAFYGAYFCKHIRTEGTQKQ